MSTQPADAGSAASRATSEPSATRPARPTWLSRACPAWCDWTHREQDYYPDRHHFATVESVELTLYDVERQGGGSHPASLDLSIIQHYRHAEPDIEIVLPDGDGWNSKVSGEATLRLTVAEASAFRDRLSTILEIVAAASAGAERQA